LQVRPEVIPPAQRSGFELIEATLTEDAARAEALRCVQCTAFCDKCVEVCPNRANFTYLITPVNLSVPLLSCQDGELAVIGHETFVVAQERQILHLDDFCNECDDCATFCVHEGEPYTEKPRLFLQESDFLLEDDNAFYLNGSTIRRREGGRESQLSVHDSTLAFENAQVRVSLSPDFEVREMVLKSRFEGRFSLKAAAEMAVILKGVTASLPFIVQSKGRRE
jgi:putative selenate reductase